MLFSLYLILEKFELAFGQIIWKIKENIQVIQAPKISTLYEYLSPCVISYMLFG